MGNRRGPVLLVAALAIALVAAACSKSSGQSGGSDTSTGATVDATMKDFAISLAQTTAAAGEVKFQIANDGPAVHEFVVLKTDTPADQLPTVNNEVTEDASGLTNVGEAEDVAPGDVVSLALTLDPGSYVAICNIRGHYASGMRVAFTVA